METQTQDNLVTENDCPLLRGVLTTEVTLRNCQFGLMFGVLIGEVSFDTEVPA
jgi:hypothetical protein